MAAPLTPLRGTLVCRGTPVGNHCLRKLTNLKDTVGLTLREEQVGSSIQPVSEGERVDEGTGRVFLIVEGHGTQVAQELTSR